MIDYELFKKLLDDSNDGYIDSDDTIDEELLMLLGKSKIDKVKSLFKKQTRYMKTNSYRVNLMCPQCNNVFTDFFSKTKLFETFSHIKKDGRSKWLCPECIKHNENIEKERQVQEKIDYPKIQKQNTEKYISIFLNPNCSWKKGIKNYEKIHDLNLNRVNKSQVIEYIKQMDYYYFLNTPYWKAISEKVKQKAGYRCQMCNSNQNLNTHHRTYDNHGDELNHINDLICICDNCHSNHHNQ